MTTGMERLSGVPGRGVVMRGVARFGLAWIGTVIRHGEVRHSAVGKGAIWCSQERTGIGTLRSGSESNGMPAFGKPMMGELWKGTARLSGMAMCATVC